MDSPRTTPGPAPSAPKRKRRSRRPRTPEVTAEGLVLLPGSLPLSPALDALAEFLVEAWLDQRPKASQGAARVPVAVPLPPEVTRASEGGLHGCA